MSSPKPDTNDVTSISVSSLASSRYLLHYCSQYYLVVDPNFRLDDLIFTPFPIPKPKPKPSEDSKVHELLLLVRDGFSDACAFEILTSLNVGASHDDVTLELSSDNQDDEAAILNLEYSSLMDIWSRKMSDTIKLSDPACTIIDGVGIESIEFDSIPLAAESRFFDSLTISCDRSHIPTSKDQSVVRAACRVWHLLLVHQLAARCASRFDFEKMRNTSVYGHGAIKAPTEILNVRSDFSMVIEVEKIGTRTVDGFSKFSVSGLIDAPTQLTELLIGSLRKSTSILSALTSILFNLPGYSTLKNDEYLTQLILSTHELNENQDYKLRFLDFYFCSQPKTRSKYRLLESLTVYVCEPSFSDPQTHPSSTLTLGHVDHGKTSLSEYYLGAFGASSSNHSLEFEAIQKVVSNHSDSLLVNLSELTSDSWLSDPARDNWNSNDSHYTDSDNDLYSDLSCTEDAGPPIMTFQDCSNTYLFFIEREACDLSGLGVALTGVNVEQEKVENSRFFDKTSCLQELKTGAKWTKLARFMR